MNKRNEQPAARRASLRRRALVFAKAAETIKNDLKRDCVPYWKLDLLRDDLYNLADDLEEFL